MRRISLALALLSAAVAGCSGGSNPNDQGGARGVAEGTFTITVQNGQNGNTALAMTHGYVTSSPSGIDCGAGRTGACSAEFPADTVVTLTATAVGLYGGDPAAVPPIPDTIPYVFLGWAGDCSAAPCELTGKADKYILAWFGRADEKNGHENRSEGATHGPKYLDLVNGVPGAQNCLGCHGAKLTGQGLSVSCQLCHYTGVQGVGMHEEMHAGHASTGCGRCHTGSGFKDYIGVDGTPNYLNGYVSNTANTEAINATPPADIIGCDTCHNSVTTLGALGSATAGTLNQIKFPQRSGAGVTVTVDGVTAICGQCHSGARDGYNVAKLAQQIKSVAADAQLPQAFCSDPAFTTQATCVAPNTWTASDNVVVRAHYLPAASTVLGKDAGNYFEYTTDANNLIYTARNEHGGKAACSDCHDPHTGHLPGADLAKKCGSCHFNEAGASVTSFLELEEVRQFGFEGDIDGDANVHESIKAEIDGLAAIMYGTLREYARLVGGTPIAYSDNRFYVDNGSGGGIANNGIRELAYCSNPSFTVSADCTAAGGTWNAGEATQYISFTPRSLRAGYNYLLFVNDVGAWAHNPRYVIEVLFDSIQDLNAGLVATSNPAFLVGPINRAFRGHFGASEDVSPYAAMTYHAYSAPPMGFTSGACYQCHGGKAGLEQYLAAPTAPAWPAVTLTPAPLNFRAYQVTAMQCSVCHAFDGADMKDIRAIPTANFPGQKAIDATNSNGVVTVAATAAPTGFTLCGTCHSGRENMASIVKKIATAPASGVGIFNKSVTNPHYLGAAGIMLGTTGKPMFEYAGRSYTGLPAFWGAATNGNAPGPHGSPHGAACAGCHRPKTTAHTFEISEADMTVDDPATTSVNEAGYCGSCHEGPYELLPIEHHFSTAKDEVLAAIRAYVAVPANLAAINTALARSDVTNICYNSAAHPYFYVETAAGCQSGSANQFNKADSKLLAATFNYLWMDKGIGAWAHNEFYVLQVAYDTIEDLGATPTFTVTAQKLPYPSPDCDPASALNRGCVAAPPPP